MCVIALNGFHGISTYKWLHDGAETSEVTPLLYTACCGTYSCIALANGQQCEITFPVTGQSVCYNSRLLMK